MKKICWLLLLSFVMCLPFSFAQADGFDRDLEEELFLKVNEYRESQGQAPFVRNTILDEYGRDWAETLSARGDLVHRSTSSLQAIREEVGAEALGENLAYNKSKHGTKEVANRILQGWIHSKSHRENMLRPTYDMVGYGVYRVGNKVYVATNMALSKTHAEKDSVLSWDRNETIEKRVPGLVYSKDTYGDSGVDRAIYGQGYTVAARNDALNGAISVGVTKTHKGSSDVILLDQNEHQVHSKGLVRVYMEVPPSTPRPFRIKVDGVFTQFAFVEGTNFVWFATEL